MLLGVRGSIIFYLQVAPLQVISFIYRGPGQEPENPLLTISYINWSERDHRDTRKDRAVF
jgi:hypothetical protein